MAEPTKDTESADKAKAAEPDKNEEPVSASDSAANESKADGKTAIDPGKMHIKVYSPYQIYFDNQAASISAVNDTGPFDILVGHHRFLTLLNPCEMMINGDAGEEKIKISRGVMYVKEDRVTVFLDI